MKALICVVGYVFPDLPDIIRETVEQDGLLEGRVKKMDIWLALGGPYHYVIEAEAPLPEDLHFMAEVVAAIDDVSHVELIRLVRRM